MVTPPKPARVLPFSSPPECSAMLVVPTPSPTKTAAISVTGLEPGQLPPGSRVLLQVGARPPPFRALLLPSSSCPWHSMQTSTLHAQDLAVKLQALSVAGGSDAASVGSPSEAFAFGLALGMAAASPARCKGALERMLTWIVVISALVVLACCALLLAGAAAATSEPAGRSFYS